MRVRKKIKISGIVSCKALVARIFTLAKKFNLSGWIKSSNDSTNLEVEGDNVSITEFMSSIYEDPRKINRVTELDSCDIPVLNTNKFYVIESDSVFRSFETAPQDYAPCSSCLDKLNNTNSKRYNYPFVSCEKCGPKYSIINSLPYTRGNSSMSEFEFCPDCKEELNKGVLDTNFSNCPVCGPKVWLKVNSHHYISQEDSFKKAAALLVNDGVLLLKSTNCFYLCADAFSQKAVEKIREIKIRKDKPLTVMAKDLQEVEKFADLSEFERELLTSKERPVVLLKLKNPDYLDHNIVGDFDNIGVMLPYNAIHHLLFISGNLKVLVMSSANKGGRAIETNNQAAEDVYGSLVDGILMHDLNILNGSDDSIVTVANHERYSLRLARGYAPNNVSLKNINSNSTVLACGAYQNSTIALATPDGKVHVSPYMGNLETANVFELYKRNVILFCKLFGVTPEYAVCDLNPDYLSTKYVMNLKVPYLQMQHHYAHLISCMADNGIQIDTPVIGVIFDGSGLGDDQTMWGGEFLVSRNMSYERAAHIPVFKMIGINGKESQIYRLGYSLLQKSGIDSSNPVYKNLKLTSEEEKMFSSLMNKGVSSPLTSSAGKLFDAIASILGISKYSSYEEYSALYLEALADKNNTDIYSLKDYHIKSLNELVQFVVDDNNRNQPISVILAKFHNTLAKMIAQTCKNISKNTGINQVALSGSIWMNIYLLEKTINELEKVNLIPIIHKNISTNDEGLSLGQAAYAVYKLANQNKAISKNITDYRRTLTR